jgi:hypothetical protein
MSSGAPRRPNDRGSPSLCDSLGAELVETHVLPRLDARSLARVAACCRSFRAFGPSSVRLVDRVARAAVLEANGGNELEACRWR